MLAEPEDVLADRIGPILRDGVPFRELIDVDRREVSFRVMNDPEIHELEMTRIFGHSWLTVGHELEIPNPGDYMLRFMGEDQVIVVRDDTGAINIMLNVCAHRGMELCRAEVGNQKQFMCPYHGWLFSTKGTLLGAPIEAQMYGDWDKSDPAYGLQRARVEVMNNGVILGNFDHDAPSLDDELGDMKWYFDSTLGDVDPSEVMVQAGFQSQSRMGGNWKIISDQFCGDNYHGITLHRSSNELQGTEANRISASIRSPRGHLVNGVELATTKEEAADILGSALNSRRIFPAGGVGGAMGGARTGVVVMDSILPKGPTNCEQMILFVATPQGFMELFGKVDLPKYIGGPVNTVVSDDCVQIPAVQRAASGPMARKFVTMKYRARYGADDAPPANFPGPAPSWKDYRDRVNVSVLKDDSEWAWWLRYFDVMTAGE